MNQHDHRPATDRDELEGVGTNGRAIDGSAGIALIPDSDDGSSVPVERSLSFAEMLVEAGMISSEDIEKAKEAARRQGIPLPRVLVRDGLVVPRDLAAFTALHLGLTMIDLRGETFDPETVGLIPEEVARQYTVLAIRREDDRLQVAMVDPTDFTAIQDLTARTAFKIEPLVATDQELLENIDVAYRLYPESTEGHRWTA